MSFTSNGPALHIQITIKKISSQILHIAGFHDGQMALSSDFSTNFIIIDQDYKIHLTKRNTVFLAGRFVNHYRKHVDWSQELGFAANFRFITPTLFLTTKTISTHITCKDKKSVDTIPANSIVKIPYNCALATDYFTINILHTTTELTVKHDISFLQLSQGFNTTRIHDVEHIKLSLKKVKQLSNMIPNVIGSTSLIDPLLQCFLIAIGCSLTPWIFAFTIINL